MGVCVYVCVFRCIVVFVLEFACMGVRLRLYFGVGMFLSG